MSVTRSFFTILMILLIAGVVSAGTYHVAKKGMDSNPGSYDRPFHTIQKAADVMKPGDTCVVHDGIYRETVMPASSGERGKPIRFTVAKGEVVTITGTEPVVGWGIYKAGIWKAKVGYDFNQLFVNGRMMIEARWPNTGFDPLHPTLAATGKGSDHTHIVDRAIPGGTGAWDGATVHITPGVKWVSWTRKVKQYDPSAHSIEIDPISTDWPYELKEGAPYYITGTLAAIDAPGEWYFDAKKSMVYLYPPDNSDPNKIRIEMKKRRYAFDLSKMSYIEIKGFHLFGTSVTLADSSHCLVDNCHFKYISHFVECDGWDTGMDDTGIVVSGTQNEVKNSSIAWSAGNGISLLGDYNKVTNCLIHDVDYAAVDCSAVRAKGRGHIVSHNTLYNSGRSVLIHRYLKAGQIIYNHIYNPGLLTTDLGCTYCFDTDGEGTEIAYNWVHDNHAHCGVGIYIDNNSPNHILHHNVSWNNSDSGIRLNIPCRNTKCYNNTLLNNGNSLNYWGPNDLKDQKGSEFTNNIFNNSASYGDGIKVGPNMGIGGDLPLVDPKHFDFRPKLGSPEIDIGVRIPGITGGFMGIGPDLGAYEFGGLNWKPGHTWGIPPEEGI